MVFASLSNRLVGSPRRRGSAVVGAVRSRKFLRSLAQSGCCDAQSALASRRPAARRFSVPRRRQRRCAQRPRRVPHCSAAAGRRANKLHKTRLFFTQRGICGACNRRSSVRVSSLARACRPPGEACGADGRVEFFCDRLLTVEKTVIRFRPSRRYLRTRVSRTTATSSSTTQPSALTVSKVDAGTVSSAKTQTHPEHPHLHRLATRVFYCRQSRAGTRLMRIRPQEPALPGAGSPPRSGPVRLARRRLVAGPTPAMSFCTGQQYP